jgi:hypothetical protein
VTARNPQVDLDVGVVCCFDDLLVARELGQFTDDVAHCAGLHPHRALRGDSAAAFITSSSAPAHGGTVKPRPTAPVRGYPIW